MNPLTESEQKTNPGRSVMVSDFGTHRNRKTTEPSQGNKFNTLATIPSHGLRQVSLGSIKNIESQYPS